MHFKIFHVVPKNKWEQGPNSLKVNGASAHGWWIMSMIGFLLHSWISLLLNMLFIPTGMSWRRWRVLSMMLSSSLDIILLSSTTSRCFRSSPVKKSAFLMSLFISSITPRAPAHYSVEQGSHVNRLKEHVQLHTPENFVALALFKKMKSLSVVYPVCRQCEPQGLKPGIWYDILYC